MKTSNLFPRSGGFVAALLLTSAVVAQPAAPDPAPPAKERVMRTITISNRAGDDAETKVVPYLGVQIIPAEPALAAQLGLPAGMGLVVQTVAADSGAADVLQQHDVLTRFADQLLINPEQLIVLIRSKQPGDEVKLTYRRGGEEKKGLVKLGERRVPVEALGMERRFQFRSEDFRAAPGAPMAPEQFEQRHLSLPGPGVSAASSTDRRNFVWHVAPGASGGGSSVARIMNVGSANLVFDDHAGTVEVKMVDGVKSAKVTDPTGQVLFEGPIATEEQRMKLSPAVKARLDALDQLDAVGFQDAPGEVDFDVRVLTPRAEPMNFRPAPSAPDSAPLRTL